MNIKPNFSLATRVATDLLKHQGQNKTFSFDVFNFSHLNTVKPTVIDSIQSYCEKCGIHLNDFVVDYKILDGFLVNLPNRDVNIILYNRELHASRIKWTIAHELGHIYLNHSADNSISEVEANVFAAQLLMPSQAFQALYDTYTCVQSSCVSRVFGVSNEAANRRITSYQKSEKSCNFADRILYPYYLKLAPSLRLPNYGPEYLPQHLR